MEKKIFRSTDPEKFTLYGQLVL